MSTASKPSPRGRRRGLVIGLIVGVIVVAVVLVLLVWRPWMPSNAGSTGVPSASGSNSPTRLTTPSATAPAEAGGTIVMSPTQLEFVDRAGNILWTHPFTDDPVAFVADVSGVLGEPTVSDLRGSEDGGFLELFQWPGLSLTTLDPALYTQLSYAHMDGPSSTGGIALRSASGIVVGNPAPAESMSTDTFVISAPEPGDCYAVELSDPAADVLMQSAVLMCVDPATTTVNFLEAPNNLG